MNRTSTRRMLRVGIASVAIAWGSWVPHARAQTAERAEIRLPRQSLAAALERLSALSKTTILADSALVGERQAPPLNGAYTVEEALEALLRGTGLQYEQVEGGGFVIRAGEPRDRAATSADVIVTGTRIRGAAPAGEHVLTFDRKDIDQSGYATTQQIIQALPQNFGGGLNEGNTAYSIRNNAGANLGAGSSVNLRGLGTTSTLTLIDGNRVALGGVSGLFVDLSLIPSSAIERIEVLADGASAIYGSDAVAGVVNVKLRDDFRGAESRARFGAADGFNEVQASQLVGLGWKTGGITLGYEYYHRGNLAAADRRYATEDLRPFGGPDYRKNFANPGTIIAADGSTYGIPAGQDGRHLTPAQLLPGQPNLADGRANSDLLPSVDRHTVFASLSQTLAPWLRFTAQGFFANRVSEFRPVPDNFGLTVVSPSNPFYVDPIGTGQPVTVNYDFTKDFGAERIRATARAWSVNAGLEATIGQWRADLHGSYGYQREDNWTTNVPNYYYLGQALADPDPATAFNVFGDGSFTPKATIDRVRGWYETLGSSRVKSASLKFDGPLFHLPGGDARMAIGGEVRGESYDSHTMLYYLSAQPVDGGSDGFPMSRTVHAGYGELSLPFIGPELNIPFVEALDLSVAARVEHYSDFGTTTNPRIGATWKLGGGLALRATWGASFRAPSFLDIRTGPGSTFYAPVAVPDPAAPTGITNALALFGANPHLGPERADTWVVGATFAPERLRGLKVDLSYFNITYKDRLGNVGIDYASFLTNRSVYQALINDHPTAALIDSYVRDPNFHNPYGIPISSIQVILDGRNGNLSSLHMNGIDFDIGYASKLGGANIAAGVSGSWIIHARQRITPTAAQAETVSTIGNPVDLRLRGRLTVAEGKWNAAAFVNFINGYRNTVVTPAQPVTSYAAVDVQVGYDLDHWIKGTRLSVSATNLFNRQPPYVQNATLYSASGFDPENASPIGRMIALQLVKSW